MLEVKVTVNGVDQGINCFSTDGGFCDAYYGIAADYGDELHGDLMTMLSALLCKGHLQGGFLLGKENHSVDFYAYEEV
jgi:hypothetical protein